MEAEAATLESPVLAGGLCRPAKSHPDFEKKDPDLIILRFWKFPRLPVFLGLRQAL